MLNLKVISKDFGILIVSVPHNEVVIVFKKIILESFGVENEDLIMNMKLVRTKTILKLNDFDYLDGLNIESNEEILVTFTRTSKSQIEFLEFSNAPTKDEIYTKTSHLRKRHLKPTYNIEWLLSQDNIRKLYVTLSQECAYIISIQPQSDKIIKFYRQKIYNYIKHHEDAFKVMCKLGFAPEKIKFALKLYGNNYKLTLDWLIDNVEYQKIDTTQSPRASLISSNRQSSILSSKFHTASTINERVDGLLEIIKFYSEKDEPVQEKRLQKMVLMGYDVDEAREALTIVRNNIGAACEYLAKVESSSVLELRCGISASSPIYEEIIENSTVQWLLSFNESFIYLIRSLDTGFLVWDTSTHNNNEYMQYIINLYRERKQAFVTNQFNNSLIPISALSAPSQ